MADRKFWSFITVEPVLFLYTLAIMLESSVLQDLISTKVCMEMTNSTERMCRGLENETFLNHLKDNQTYQNTRSSFISYHNAILYGLNLLVASYVGSWSDRLGRKAVMLIPPIASLLAAIVPLIVSSYPSSNIQLIFVSSVLSGLSGGMVSFIAACFGYISNVTSTATRNKRIALAEAALILGSTIGMFLGGGMLKHTDYPPIFELESCLHAVSIFYILFLIKEIRPEDRVPGLNICIKLFSGRHVVDMISTVFRPREDYRRSFIILSLIATLLVYYGLTVQIVLLYLYVTSEPLKWNQDFFSYFSAENFAVSGSALLLGLPVAYHFFKMRDTTAAIMGISSRMAGLIFLGLARSDRMMFICPVFFIFSDYSIPALRSILSKLVNADETGKLFAFMASLQNISFLTGTLFNTIYLYTSPYFCFELVAGFQALALGILIFLHINLEKRTITYTEMDPEITSAQVSEIR